MASGTISLSYDTPLQGRIVWSSSSNGTAANSSTVTATIQAKRADGYITTGTFKGNLNIGGDNRSFSYYGNVGGDWVSLFSFSITKSHSSDGSGSCYIQGKVSGPTETSLEGKSVSGSATVTLDTIARAATITSAPNFDDEDSPVLKYSNPAGNSVTSLQACISLTGAKDDIEYRNISKTGSSYTFNLTDAERKVLRQATTTSNSRKVRFYVKTVIGGETYLKYIEKTLTIVNAAPTLAPTAIDGGSVSTKLTGDASGKVIKGYNSMTVTANAAAKKEATISSYKISCGSKSITTATGKLTNVDSGSFVFSVTDSRGNTASKTLDKTLINYVKLTCNLTAKAPTTGGEMTFTVKGNYFNGSFGAVANSLQVQYRIKENDGSYSDWQALTFTLSNNTYTANGAISGLNYLNSYTIQARALDAIYNADTEPAVATEEKKVKTTPVFDWGEKSIAFHTPLFMDNTKQIWYKDTDGNDVLMVSMNDMNQSFFGYGAYNAGLGSTYFDGNSVYIRSKNNINNAAGGTIGGNKAWTNSSDNRLKDNIVDIPTVFYNVWLELAPKAFNWNEINGNDGLQHFGLIAQDVIAAFEKYGLDYKQYGFVSIIPVEGVDYFAITYENYNMLTALALKKTIEEVSTLKSQLAEIKMQMEVN